MSNPIEEKDCFLCAASVARSQKAEGGNVERFLCAACGDYDIVGRARTRLANNADLKTCASVKAKSIRAAEPDKVLVVSVNPATDKVIFTARPRLPFP